MPLMRTAWLPTFLALLLLPPAHAEVVIELDTASDSMFVAPRAKVTPAAEHKQAGNFLEAGLKTLRSKTTVAGLIIAVGAKIFTEFKDDVFVLWTRFIRLFHKDGSAAAEAREWAPSHLTDYGWQAPTWMYKLVSLSLAAFVACMIRRQHVESRRVSLLASRAVVVPTQKSLNMSASQSPKRVSLESSSTRLSSGSISDLESDGKYCSTGSENYPGFYHSEEESVNEAAVVAIKEMITQRECAMKERKEPPKELNALAPWGEGLVAQRMQWFDKTTGPAVEDKLFNTKSSRPTGDHIDELSRLTTGQSFLTTADGFSRQTTLRSRCTYALEDSLDELEDMLCQKRQETEKSGDALEGEGGSSSMFFKYNAGTAFAA